MCVGKIKFMKDYINFSLNIFQEEIVDIMISKDLRNRFTLIVYK